jgi:hypothetical protein
MGFAWKVNKKSQWCNQESGEKPGFLGPDKSELSDFFTFTKEENL